jgi:Tol biopolymer transport system component
MASKKIITATAVLALCVLSCQAIAQVIDSTAPGFTQTPPATNPPAVTLPHPTSTTALGLPPSSTPATKEQESQANKVEDIAGVWLEKFAGGSAQIEIKPDGITIFTILSGANEGYRDQSKSWFKNGELRVKTDGSQETGIYNVYVTRRDGQAVEMRYALVEDPNVARRESMTYAPLTIIKTSPTPTPQRPAATSAPTLAPIPGIDVPVVVKNASLKSSLGYTETVDLSIKILDAITQESLPSGDEPILPEDEGDVFLSLKLALEGSLNALEWIASNVTVKCGEQTYQATRTGIEFSEGVLKSWQVHYPIPANAGFGACSVQLPDGREIPLGRFFDSTNLAGGLSPSPVSPTGMATFTPEPGRVYETEGGFSYVPPEGWKVSQAPGFDYKVAAGPKSGDFVPNLFFFINPSHSGSLDEFISGNLEHNRSILENLEVISQEDFLTSEGKRGVKVIDENTQRNIRVRQTSYYFEAGARKFVATYTRLADKGQNNDALIDQSMKTFRPVTTADGGSSSTLPSGKIVFVSERDGNAEIYTVHADGSNLTRLTRNTVEDYEPAWSPDGMQIAYASNLDGDMEIYVMDAKGANLVQLTDNDVDDLGPVWSPDGSQLAYYSLEDGDWDILLMNVDGSNPHILTNNQAQDTYPAWSPDGNKIAFHSDRDGNWEIYIMDANGRNQRRLTVGKENDWLPTWSPDGKEISFWSKRNGQWEVYSMDAGGRNQRPLTKDAGAGKYVSRPAWSPDGQYLAVAVFRDSDGEIYLVSLDGLNWIRLTNAPGIDADPDWAP